LFFGHISTSGINITVVDTSIGTINPGGLSLFDNVALDVIVGLVNSVLGLGFPLPVAKGIALDNQEILLNDGFVGISADITLNPAMMTLLI